MWQLKPKTKPKTYTVRQWELRVSAGPLHARTVAALLTPAGLTRLPRCLRCTQFFYEAGNIAAVRSSAGGLTLLRK